MMGREEKRRGHETLPLPGSKVMGKEAGCHVRLSGACSHVRWPTIRSPYYPYAPAGLSSRAPLPHSPPSLPPSAGCCCCVPSNTPCLAQHVLVVPAEVKVPDHFQHKHSECALEDREPLPVAAGTRERREGEGRSQGRRERREGEGRSWGRRSLTTPGKQGWMG